MTDSHPPWTSSRGPVTPSRRRVNYGAGIKPGTVHFTNNSKLSIPQAGMCGLTGQAMQGATHTLLDADLALAEDVIDRHHEIAYRRDKRTGSIGATDRSYSWSQTTSQATNSPPSPTSSVPHRAPAASNGTVTARSHSLMTCCHQQRDHS
jgi:hypothetical protein